MHTSFNLLWTSIVISTAKGNLPPTCKDWMSCIWSGHAT